MADPLVSVVVPAFNRAASVRRSIESVLRQSYERLEVIVVDDGSADGTAAAAQSLPDSRVRVLANARCKGAQGARNTGILAARGEWIAFNDSDDEWRPRKLALQLEELRRKSYAPETVVHGDAFLCEPERGRRRRLRLPHTEGNAYRQLLLRPAPMLQALVASRRLLEEIGLLDETLAAYQEWDTAIRLAQRGSFVHLRVPLFDYFAGHDGAISRDPRRDIEGYLSVLRKHAPHVIRLHGHAGLRRHYQWLLRRAVTLGVPELAAALQAEAIESARITGLRRGLLVRACADPGLLGTLAHRIAQLHDRAAGVCARLR